MKFDAFCPTQSSDRAKAVCGAFVGVYFYPDLPYPCSSSVKPLNFISDVQPFSGESVLFLEPVPTAEYVPMKRVRKTCILGSKEKKSNFTSSGPADAHSCVWIGWGVFLGVFHRREGELLSINGEFLSNAARRSRLRPVSYNVEARLAKRDNTKTESGKTGEFRNSSISRMVREYAEMVGKVFFRQRHPLSGSGLSMIALLHFFFRIVRSGDGESAPTTVVWSPRRLQRRWLGLVLFRTRRRTPRRVWKLVSPSGRRPCCVHFSEGASQQCSECALFHTPRPSSYRSVCVGNRTRGSVGIVPQGTRPTKGCERRRPPSSSVCLDGREKNVTIVTALDCVLSVLGNLCDPMISVSIWFSVENFDFRLIVKIFNE